MYKCEECGEVFSDPKTIYDDVPYGMGTVSYPAESVCPSCGGHYDFAIECECCGETFCKSELKNGFCEECFKIEEERDKDVTTQIF